MNRAFKMLMRGIKDGRIKVWDGQQVQIHICASEQIHDNDFESACVVCKKTAYYRDWCGAKVYVHMECLPNLPTDEKELEAWIKKQAMTEKP